MTVSKWAGRQFTIEPPVGRTHKWLDCRTAIRQSATARGEVTLRMRQHCDTLLPRGVVVVRHDPFGEQVTLRRHRARSICRRDDALRSRGHGVHLVGIEEAQRRSLEADLCVGVAAECEEIVGRETGDDGDAAEETEKGLRVLVLEAG